MIKFISINGTIRNMIVNAMERKMKTNQIINAVEK